MRPRGSLITVGSWLNQMKWQFWQETLHSTLIIWFAKTNILSADRHFLFIYFISFIGFTGRKTNKYDILKSRLQNRNKGSTPIGLQKSKLYYCRVDFLMLPLMKQTCNMQRTINNMALGIAPLQIWYKFGILKIIRFRMWNLLVVNLMMVPVSTFPIKRLSEVKRRNNI